jgi:2-oxoglutarate dehydrogenase E1 component
MGAWRFLVAHMGFSIAGVYPFSGCSRPASASPATGSAQSHRIEESKLMKAAFEDGWTN